MDYERLSRDWKQEAQRQAALAKLGQRALADVDLQSFLDEAARVAARQLNAEYSMVLEHFSGIGAVLRAGSGWEEGVIGQAALDTDPGSLAAYTLDSEGPVIIEDGPSEERFRIPSLIEERGIASGVSVAVQSGETPWGVLSVHAENRFTQEDVDFIEAVADLLGRALDRRQAEERLSKSEAKYRTLAEDALDTSEVGTLVLDADFQVVWMNRAIENFFGIKEEEVIGKDKRVLVQVLKDIFEDDERFAEKILSTYNGNTYSERFEVHVLPDKERGERWLEHRSTPIESGLYAGGRIEHYTDITGRKEAEEEARRSAVEQALQTQAEIAERERAQAEATESTFRQLFENVPGHYLIVEPGDYEIVAASDAYLRTTMTERADIMGKKLFDVFPADPNEPQAEGVRRLRASLDRVKADGQADVMPVTRYPIPRPDSDNGGFEERWWSPVNAPVFGAGGDVEYIIIRAEDVTPVVRKLQAESEDNLLQRLYAGDAHITADVLLRGQELQRAKEEAYEQLRESEERYRTLFERIDEGFCIVEVLFDTSDSPVDYRFLETNPAFEGLTGLVDAEGKRIREMKPNHERHWFEAYGRVARTGEPERFTREAKHLGDRRYDVYAFRIGRPEERKVAILFRDITERTLREQRDRFLAEFTERLHLLDDPEEIMATASRLLGKHLNVDRCTYAEVEEDEDQFVTGGDYVLGDEPPPVERFHPSAFGAEALRLMQANQTFVVENVGEDERITEANRDMYERAQVQAMVCVPLHREGQLVAGMAVHQQVPRHWSPEEIELAKIVTNRCWEALERARVTRDLRESEQRYRLLVERTVEYAIFMVDLDGSISSWSAGAARIFGYTEEEALGQSTAITFTEEDRRAGIPEQERQTATEEGQAADERWHLRKDGSRFWASGVMTALYDAEGELQGFAKVTRDNTDRKRTQDALRESEERFRAVAENAVDIIAIVNEGTEVQFISPSVEEVLGYAPGELNGQRLLECVHPDDLHQARNDFARLVFLSGKIASFSLRFECKDGATRHLSVKARNLKDRPGVRGLLLNIRDVTEIKEHEEQLIEAKEKAEEMTRLKSNLLANMSHEIRTPLTGILGLASGLARKLSGEHQNKAQLIERSGERLMGTLNSVLTLAQLEGNELDPRPELLNVTDKVEEIARPLKELAREKGLAFEVNSSAPDARAVLDPAFLDRIVNNLVGNAIKFTEAGEVRLEITASDGHVDISVHDTGRGINEEFLPHIFDEFKQESTGFARTHEGAGLGLVITKRLVEASGGTISVESAEGEGSTFTVTFPRTDAVVQGDREDIERKGTARSTTPSEADAATDILLVEDNDIIRAVFEEELGDRYTVESFADAESALERANEKTFDLVLLDVGLPGMDGVEALKRLRSREQYAACPIVAVTGHALPGDRERFLEAGFTRFLAKPFTPNELLDVVEAALE